MADETALEARQGCREDRGLDTGTEAGTGAPDIRDTHGLDEWLGQNDWLVTHPRRTAACIALFHCLLIIWAPGFVTAFLLTPALIFLVLALSRASEAHGLRTLEEEKRTWLDHLSELKERRRSLEETRLHLTNELNEIRAAFDSFKREHLQERDAERAGWEAMRDRLESELATSMGQLEELDQMGRRLEKSARRETRLARDKEKLEKLTESIGRDHLKFFDNVSGGLRAPLQIATGLVDELASQASGEKARKAADELHGNLRRLKRLVEQVVDLCQLESAHWHALRVDVNVRQLVARCAADLQELAASRRVDLQTDLEIDLPTIQTDERLLARTLNEVLLNGVRYTSEGGKVKVVARLAEGESRADGQIIISITDSGLGILPQDLDRIFLPFEKSASQPNFRTANVGAGLGLTLARRYLEKLEGSIDVESEPEAGTTFHIRVPITAPD